MIVVRNDANADHDRFLRHLARLVEHSRGKRDVQLRQVDVADQPADERHEHIADKARRDLAEGPLR